MLEFFKKVKRRKRRKNKFNRGNIPNLRYGIIHSRFGYPDGVSIVMKQIDKILVQKLKIPKRNVFYLVGRSKIKFKRIIEKEILWDDAPLNRLIEKRFQIGFGGEMSEKVEKAISESEEVIKEFIEKNKIDVLITHNSSHAVNFIFSVALSRYYRDTLEKGKKTPKYILWWHDSHLERKEFSNPSKDVENYLLQGVPGFFVEYVLFVNSLQFMQAKKYFRKLDKISHGFYHNIEMNHDVVFNTTDVFIKNFKDLKSDEFNDRVERFIEDFEIKKLLKKNKLQLSDVLFCLQHTRTINRKRIDFALRYCYALLKKLQEKDSYKALYFLVSGGTSKNRLDAARNQLVRLNNKLRKEHDIKNLFLVFAEDYYNKTDISFEEYPKIFAKLGGIATYFSEVEGFGNNLLEVLASGLIPIIYTYPVFKKDIAKYNFNIISLSKYEISDNKLEENIDLIKNNKKRREYINQNLRILKRSFPHRTIAIKLIQAIVSERTHK